MERAKRLTVVLVSLGCAKNLVDSEYMLGLLSEAGFDVRASGVDADELADWLSGRGAADLCIVNTCGFIDAAKEESVQAIIGLGRLKESGRLRALIAAGCLAQRYADELMSAVPELDAVLGTGDLAGIVSVAERALGGWRLRLVGPPAYGYDRLLPRFPLTPSYTAYLKLAEGCDHSCAFCVIPSLRGRYRSRPLETVVAEAARLADSGVREINLVSQDCAFYGVDTERRQLLPDLLTALDQVPGIDWVRVLYNYPTTFTDALAAALARTAKACHYVDIPLQHGSDRILAAMGRGGSRADLLRRIAAIRAILPDAVFRSSFIVGFPGETERDFREMLSFLDEAELDYAGFFTYSAEEGTPAATLPGQVPDEVKEERWHRATERQRAVSRRRHARHVGRVLAVLVEEAEEGQEGYFRGRWRGQAPEVDGQVIFRARPGGRPDPGAVVLVRVTHYDDCDLFGEEVPGPAAK